MSDDEIRLSSTVHREVIAGHEAIALENSNVRVTIIPALGGRVWELLDRTRGRQWIWHREGKPLTAAPPASEYDEVWAGGWEELFPNDAPGRFEGRELLDHGCWWSTSWAVANLEGGDEAVVRLTAKMVEPNVTCVKEFRLPSAANALGIRYEIQSHERMPFHFLFKQHLPVALTPLCRLLLPGGLASAVDPSFGNLLSDNLPFAWPIHQNADGTTVDLSRVLDRSSMAREFVYVADLPEGWCGVVDVGCGASLRLEYDANLLPFVWLFLTYGGWRDCYTAVLEPCTNMPKDLATAVRLGQSACLAPGNVFRTGMKVTLGAASVNECRNA